MMKQKQEMNVYRAATQTLMPDFQLTAAFQPHSARLFPSRNRKLKQVSSLKQAKVLTMIEDIDFCRTEQNERARMQSKKKRYLQSKGKISSYLAYKKQQQILKMQQLYNSKMTYLRNRCFQRRQSTPKGRQSAELKSFTLSPGSQKKLSMSKIDLVLGKEEKGGIKKKDIGVPRHFYLATAEGRRQKLNSFEYSNKMMSRVGKRQEKPSNSQSFLKLNQYADSPLFFVKNQILTEVQTPRKPTISKPGQQSKPRISTVGRRTNSSNNHSNNMPNRLLEQSDEGCIDCRPWTSKKSQYYD